MKFCSIVPLLLGIITTVMVTNTIYVGATRVGSSRNSDEKLRHLKRKGKDGKMDKDDESSSSSDEELSSEEQNSDFAYPDNMPRPPMMWIEGFASRLHAGPIQRYETPIQVWQTWRLDQVCCATAGTRYHVCHDTSKTIVKCMAYF